MPEIASINRCNPLNTNHLYGSLIMTVPAKGRGGKSGGTPLQFRSAVNENQLKLNDLRTRKGNQR